MEKPLVAAKKTPKSASSSAAATTIPLKAIKIMVKK